MKKYSYIFILVVTNLLIINILAQNIKVFAQYNAEVNEIIEKKKISGVNISTNSANMEMFNELSKINGTTYTQIEYNQGEDYDTPSTVVIDKSYYDNVFKEKEYFSEEDFKIVYDKGMSVPAVVTKNFALENNLKVGDVFTIDTPPPTICDMFAASSHVTGFNGSVVATKEDAAKKECVADSKFDNQEGQFEYQIKVVAIEDVELKYFNDIKLSNNEILIPFFVPNNSNIDLIDLKGYENFQRVITMSSPTLIVDYSKISEQELQKEVEEVSMEYGDDIELSSQVDNELGILESEFQLKMRSIIFKCVLVVILMILAFTISILYSKSLVQIINVMILFGKKKSNVLLRRFSELIVINFLVALLLDENMMMIFILCIFEIITMYIYNYFRFKKSIIEITNEEEYVN